MGRIGRMRPICPMGLRIEETTMIIVIRPGTTEAQIEHVVERIVELGLKPHVSKGETRTIIGVIGDESKLQAQPLQAIPGVEQVLPVMKPFKLASREMRKADTVVVIGANIPGVTPLKVGGGSMMMVAGPCAIEGEEVLRTI